jgi:hypothetical protein
VAATDSCNAGVARGGVELAEAAALREPPGERVLAPTGADQEDLHQEPSLLCGFDEQATRRRCACARSGSRPAARGRRKRGAPRTRSRDGPREPHVAARFLEAHRVARLIDAGEASPPGDVASAANDLSISTSCRSRSAACPERQGVGEPASDLLVRLVCTGTPPPSPLPSRLTEKDGHDLREVCRNSAGVGGARQPALCNRICERVAGNASRLTSPGQAVPTVGSLPAI